MSHDCIDAQSVASVRKEIAKLAEHLIASKEMLGDRSRVRDAGIQAAAVLAVDMESVYEMASIPIPILVQRAHAAGFAEYILAVSSDIAHLKNIKNT